ncbi:MAG: SusC/RagA family TonB-linked outer membrane protein, partial [Bacteroidales bacterium]
MSSLGMKSIKLPFAPDKLTAFRLIEMSEDEQKISEVVVVGFGKQKKESVIGAIQTLKPQELVVPSSSLTSAFAGKIAGVIAVQRSGEPGADGANFWIRGISTFAGPTNPLIVMDGVEISASDLNAIAPESIESFSILKDATATALYGAKGANGVMVVTTKSGKDMDKPKINLRAEYFMSKPTQLPSFVDGVTYMKLYNQAATDRNQGVALYPDDKILGTEQGLNAYLYPNVDWYNLMFKELSHNQSANLNVMGGSKKIDYFINAAVFNETGMYRNSSANSFKNNNIKQKRFSFQNNINAQLTSTTKIGLRINSQIREHDGPGYGSEFLFNKANKVSPVEYPAFFPASDDVTHIMFGDLSNNPVGNPLAYLLSRQRNELETTVLTSFNAEQKLDFLTKGLSMRALASFQGWSKKSTCYGYDPFFYEISSYDPVSLEYTLRSVGKPGTEDLRVVEDWRGVNSTINYQFAFDYDRTFDNIHSVSGMLLYHQREYRTPSNNLYETLPYRDQGVAGRATYNFDSRYFAEFNFGYNGSENFKKGKRFGFFPSVALGYMISNEKFFEPLTNTISLLKVRGSYGLVGNSFTSPRFPYITEVQLNNSDYSFAFGDNWNNYLNGVLIRKYGQEKATWETGKKLNVGLELGLLNKLTMIVDIFKEDRSGIFMQRRMVPSTVGIGSSLPYANIGRVENKGGDMSIDFNHAFRHDFIINLKGNLTYSVNKLIDKDEPKQLYEYQSEIGQPIGRPFGLIAQGLYTKDDIAAIAAGTQAKPAFGSDVMEGDIKYKDMNGDMIIDNFDRTYFGNPDVPSLV